MELQLKIIGILLIILALVHIIFPKYFDWNKELRPLTLINRQIVYVHTFFIAFGVLLMGILCFTSSNELVETHLGKSISFGLGIFWAVRLFVQLFGYSAKLWRGKKAETTIHVVFALLWTYFAIVFVRIYLA